MLIFPRENTFSPKGLIETEEKAYRDQIQLAAGQILDHKVRFVFLAGPSCSGKSTTAFCLGKALEDKGKKVLTFSTDDFFFDKEKAPINPDGSPNYDAFSHTDSALITETLRSLSQGNKTPLPGYDFITGKRILCTQMIDPREHDIFLLEGIHALNDVILDGMPPNEPYLCFYLDVTESVQSEAGGGIFTPERIRFCRRLIRDFKHRGASPNLTEKLWRNVVEAEKDILHPFRKNAFGLISSSFSYEIAVEKQEIVTLLSSVTEKDHIYPRAQRILADLQYFPALSEALVPQGSVLKEFID
ncbi:MAG: hypothetical protein E7580_06355 [Ruminococcaceae bacterium]|nr:hypothetical protein [Oscillospiraceae bacterium]